ncbi:MAG: F0F1 ATP synthase subunit A [Acidobacteriota bacterium]
MAEATSLPTIAFDKLTGVEASDYLVMLGFIMISSLLFFYFATRKMSVSHPNVFQQFLELVVESFDNLLTEIIGKNGRNYLPAMGTFGVLIFLSNLSGFIPGLMPPTGNIVVTLSLGLCSFLVYNLIGLYKGGFSYVKHFMGPIAAIAVLFAPIELVSHCFRPISLGIRLFCNIFGDHQVGSIFLQLVPFGVPVPFILLGLFVAFMQTFVFVLLSAVYIAMALPHEDENH